MVWLDTCIAHLVVPLKKVCEDWSEGTPPSVGVLQGSSGILVKVCKSAKTFSRPRKTIGNKMEKKSGVLFKAATSV